MNNQEINEKILADVKAMAANDMFMDFITDSRLQGMILGLADMVVFPPITYKLTPLEYMRLGHQLQRWHQYKNSGFLTDAIDYLAGEQDRDTVVDSLNYSRWPMDTAAVVRPQVIATECKAAFEDDEQNDRAIELCHALFTGDNCLPGSVILYGMSAAFNMYESFLADNAPEENENEIRITLKDISRQLYTLGEKAAAVEILAEQPSDDFDSLSVLVERVRNLEYMVPHLLLDEIRDIAEKLTKHADG